MLIASPLYLGPGEATGLVAGPPNSGNWGYPGGGSRTLLISARIGGSAAQIRGTQADWPSLPATCSVGAPFRRGPCLGTPIPRELLLEDQPCLGAHPERPCLGDSPEGRSAVCLFSRNLSPRTGPVWGCLFGTNSLLGRPALSGDFCRRAPFRMTRQGVALRCAYSAGAPSPGDRPCLGAAAPMRRSSRAGPLTTAGPRGHSRTHPYNWGYPGKARPPTGR